jgi:hypothetical protein
LFFQKQQHIPTDFFDLDRAPTLGSPVIQRVNEPVFDLLISLEEVERDPGTDSMR